MEADYKVKYHTQIQRNLQNRDGSFSTNYYVGPGYSNDFQVRLRTSGHQAEWLMVALPERQLKEEWVQRGLRSIANDLITNARANVEDVGALYHAIHALVLYRQRTIPGYLVPQRNSNLKLADRDKPYVPGSRPTRRNASANTKADLNTSNSGSKAVVDPSSAPAPSKRADANKVEPVPTEKPAPVPGDKPTQVPGDKPAPAESRSVDRTPSSSGSGEAPESKPVEAATPEPLKSQNRWRPSVPVERRPSAATWDLIPPA
jgi:hypothetical protein